MKANLMFREKDFDLNAEPRFGQDALIADFELNRVLLSMAREDQMIETVCTVALCCPLRETNEIQYRQENLRDALRNPEAVRRLYEITVDTEKKIKSSMHWLSSIYLSSTFSSAIELLKIYISMLMELRTIADRKISDFQSDGFRTLLTMLQRELSDDYFAEINSQLKELKEGNNTLISATIGNYLQGTHYVLRRRERKDTWWRWQFAPSFTIAPRDDAGAKDLAKRRDRAINEVANALAQAAEHLSGFFDMLRRELAFYVGCLNLSDTLQALEMPICFPDLQPLQSCDRSWQNLYDVSLALMKNSAVVSNNLETTNKSLYIVTGANQGGKSTFLRSIGQAQLMAQCGMFVGAACFAAPLRKEVFSHFKKEEDSSMKSGKLDEELSRMSEIVDHLASDTMILFNESFSSTNEREGSEIFRQITLALIENRIEIFSVTHLYAYATAFLENKQTQFLRAERLDTGERTFQIVPGEPLQTAFGSDLYKKIFEKI